MSTICDSIMIAECLVALGEELAKGLRKRGCHRDSVAAWTQARVQDDLPTVAAEREPMAGTPPEIIWQQACYYARKLGLPLDLYRDAALFESAAHLLWHEAGQQGPEPVALDGFRRAIIGTLPSAAELEGMAAKARVVTADPELDTAEAWKRGALHQANLDARAIVFYRGWPNRMEPRKAIFPGPDADT
jgi:hypothetical protein